MRRACVLLVPLLLVASVADASYWRALETDLEVWNNVGTFFEFRLLTMKADAARNEHYDTVDLAIDCHSGNVLLLYYRKGQRIEPLSEAQWGATLSGGRTHGQRMVEWACRATYTRTPKDEWLYHDPIGAYWRRFGVRGDHRITMVGIDPGRSHVVVVNCRDRAIRIIALTRHGGGGKELRFAPWEPLEPKYPSMHDNVCRGQD